MRIRLDALAFPRLLLYATKLKDEPVFDKDPHGALHPENPITIFPTDPSPRRPIPSLSACAVLLLLPDLDQMVTHAQRLVIGLVGAMFIMLVELMVFVVRSLKADEVLEAARQVIV